MSLLRFARNDTLLIAFSAFQRFICSNNGLENNVISLSMSSKNILHLCSKIIQ